jgi:hypothetical protein
MPETGGRPFLFQTTQLFNYITPRYTVMSILEEIMGTYMFMMVTGKTIPVTGRGDP